MNQVEFIKAFASLTSRELEVLVKVLPREDDAEIPTSACSRTRITTGTSRDSFCFLCGTTS